MQSRRGFPPISPPPTRLSSGTDGHWERVQSHNHSARSEAASSFRSPEYGRFHPKRDTCFHQDWSSDCHEGWPTALCPNPVLIRATLAAGPGA